MTDWNSYLKLGPIQTGRDRTDKPLERQKIWRATRGTEAYKPRQIVMTTDQSRNPIMNLSHIPQRTNREQKCWHFCSIMMYCGIWDRCIVEYQAWLAVSVSQNWVYVVRLFRPQELKMKKKIKLVYTCSYNVRQMYSVYLTTWAWFIHSYKSFSTMANNLYSMQRHVPFQY